MQGTEIEQGRLSRLASCVAHDATPTDLRNIRRWMAWMAAWAVVTVLDAELFGGVTGQTSAASVVVAGLVVVTVVGLVVAFARFVRESDELNRTVHLRALAAGFAAGFVTTMVAESLVDAGLVTEVQLDVPTLVMILTYGAVVVTLTARYR